jgi:hypothetical protein
VLSDARPKVWWLREPFTLVQLESSRGLILRCGTLTVRSFLTFDATLPMIAMTAREFSRTDTSLGVQLQCYVVLWSDGTVMSGTFFSKRMLTTDADNDDTSSIVSRICSDGTGTAL